VCCAERRREWKKNHPEQTRETQHTYYLAHRDQRLAKSKQWQQDHKDRVRELCRNWKAKNPDKAKASLLWTRYKLKWETYLELLRVQRNVCAICQKPFGSGSPPCVDHDHTTGQVRGLLCRKCNTAIGSLQESSTNAERAALYFQKALTPFGYIRRFVMIRFQDETGISGVGVVACGVEWPDNSVSLRWLGETPSFVNYEQGIDHVEKVHGHGGKTIILFYEAKTCPLTIDKK
jgi:hypothetical protein